MSRRKIDASADLAAALDGAALQGRADERQREERTLAAEVVRLSVHEIQARPGGDVRKLDPEHAVRTAESIAAVGLVHLVAVDQRNRLLAGLHRVAALRLLATPGEDARAALVEGWGGGEEWVQRAREIDPPTWVSKPIPVRRMAIDAEADQPGAIAIEASENERRRDFSAGEIRELADRLKESGFTFRGGRPARGEKRLLPALEAIVGRSERTLRRALGAEVETRPSGRVSENEVDPIADADRLLRKLEGVVRDRKVFDLPGGAFKSYRRVLKMLRELEPVIGEAREELAEAKGKRD